jgi:hypothetical protein
MSKHLNYVLDYVLVGSCNLAAVETEGTRLVSPRDCEAAADPQTGLKFSTELVGSDHLPVSCRITVRSGDEEDTSRFNI